jgi:hypothetical protein
MARKMNWKEYRRDYKATHFVPGGNIAEHVVPRSQKPIHALIGEIRAGLDPPVLRNHINQIAERGDSSHIKLFELLLRRFPQREQSPYPYYDECREALVKGIEKLKAK